MDLVSLCKLFNRFQFNDNTISNKQINKEIPNNLVAVENLERLFQLNFEPCAAELYGHCFLIHAFKKTKPQDIEDLVSTTDNSMRKFLMFHDGFFLLMILSKQSLGEDLSDLVDRLTIGERIITGIRPAKNHPVDPVDPVKNIFLDRNYMMCWISPPQAARIIIRASSPYNIPSILLIPSKKPQ